METLFILIILGIIPGMIARSKGRNFFLWFIYGSLIFIIALVHSILIKSNKKIEDTAKEPREDASRELKKDIKADLLNTLTDVSGVSDKVARTLMDQFPTLESIKNASIDELSDIPGVGKSVAKAIKARCDNL